MPSGRAMFAMLSVVAEFERSILRDRIMAGPARSSTKAPASTPQRSR
ncbi:recombinase family protein [Sphingomonas sanguinis]